MRVWDLSWEMNTLVLSNLIQQGLEEGPPEVPAPELLVGISFSADLRLIRKIHGLLVEKPEK